MIQKRHRLLCLAWAGILAFSLLSPAALAAERSDTVSLRTVEDLVRLSQNCSLDSWSQ